MKLSTSAKGAAIITVFAAAVMIVGFGAFKLAGGLGEHQTVAKCGGGEHREYKLEIKNDRISPDHVSARLCDRITITNRDDRSRLMAFGQHDRHQAYDGVTERYLLKNESFAVTLDQAGSFLVHDHHEDEVQATFKVAK